VDAYEIPTECPESDGTLEWSSTPMIVVHVRAAGETGMGYAYTSEAAARIVETELAGTVEGSDPLDVPGIWEAMRHEVRNLGRPGIVSSAVSAVDTALWDLKARLLNLPLASLLGRLRERVPVYGSGGFTSLSVSELQSQLEAWVSQGMRWVKMKVGRRPGDDPERVRAAREAVGQDAGLMVDANGAYGEAQALELARVFAEAGVCWFEEPVTSDDRAGLRRIRDRAPAGMRIAAGEYGWTLYDFVDLARAGSVDVIQADITRCGGLTPFLRVADLCEAVQLPFSPHTAPSLHLHPACAVPRLLHVEYFHDHERIERMLFEGFREPRAGWQSPDLGRPGHGLELRRRVAETFRV